MSLYLNIAIIQSDIIWESSTKNLDNYTKKIDSINTHIDLIILPEMFATGFTMNVETQKQSMSGEIVSWMKHIATSRKTAIYGSVIITENNKIYNRALFIFPDGETDFYDKKHLFTLAGEHNFFNKGLCRKIIEYKGWRIMPLICYDLRFPVWSRNNLNYDLLIYIASWPEKRKYAWQTLLKARAIENMCYVIGTNRVGTDGNNFTYSGNSVVINSMGKHMAESEEYKNCTFTVTINKKELIKNRTMFSFLNDKDNFEIV
jgi:predicted amidohydrolase